MSDYNNKPRALFVKKDIFLKIWNKGIPLFFFNKCQEYNSISHDYDTVWKPENTSIESNVREDDAFSHAINDVAFIYVKPLNSSDIGLSSDMMEVEYEDFNPNNFSHVKAVFLLHLSNRYNAQDKYACRELLWYLNNYYIDQEILVRVLGEFDEQSIRPFFINELKQYALCLSIPKQNLIQRVIAEFGARYRRIMRPIRY